MILEIKKFGNILNSRPAGREAVLAAKQIINGLEDIKEIILDLNEVDVVTPSFADEFISGLKQIYPNSEIKFKGLENNPAIKDVIESIKK